MRLIVDGAILSGAGPNLVAAAVGVSPLGRVDEDFQQARAGDIQAIVADLVRALRIAAPTFLLSAISSRGMPAKPPCVRLPCGARPVHFSVVDALGLGSSGSNPGAPS